MALPEIQLLQAAIVLAEELSFTKAAERLHIEQSTLSRQISKLETQVGVRLFVRNHQTVELTEAGRHFVEEARTAILHAERAVMSATAASRGVEEILAIGKSSYTDPYLVSLILSVRLPLFPGLKIKLWSNYSYELAREVMVGSLDLAVTTGIPENPRLSCLKLAEGIFYIALSSRNPLAARREFRLRDLHSRNWVLFSRHVGPYLYDMIEREAAVAGVRASDLYHVSSPEEAIPLILENDGLAFLNRASAWRIARDGITMRPLAEDNLRLVARLAARADNKSRLITEFVKATSRKLDSLRGSVHAGPPLCA